MQLITEMYILDSLELISCFYYPIYEQISKIKHETTVIVVFLE